LQGGATQEVQLEFLFLRVQGGELDEVEPTLRDCVEKGHPASPLILETLARAHMHRLRYRPAYEYLSRWIKLRPNEAKPYHWRGWVLERLNQAKAAAEDYHRALALDPNLVRVRLRVVEMLLEDKQAPEAIPHAELLYRQAPDDPEVQARLGMCRYYQNRRQEARRLLEQAEAHLPKDAGLLLHLANLDIEEGRAAEAERRLRKVLETDPSDTEALYNLASALQLQGRGAEADRALKQFDLAKEKLARVNKLLRQVVDSPTATAEDYAEIGSLLLEVRRDQLGLWLVKR